MPTSTERFAAIDIGVNATCLQQRNLKLLRILSMWSGSRYGQSSSGSAS